MAKIIFVAHERHFFDHLIGIYDGLKDVSSFYVSASIYKYARKYCPEVVDYTTPHELIGHLAKRDGKQLAVTASWGDCKRMMLTGMKQVYMEHGAGQTYKGTNSASYASGGIEPDREGVVLYLCPSDYTAEVWSKKNPHIPVKVIGCSKLDKWHDRSFAKHTPPTVALSFHWDCVMCPETRSSFSHYRPVLPEIGKMFHAIGHAHPRLMDTIRYYYIRAGITVVENFNDVVEQADVYVTDNSSSLFEFASTNRPVVVLNAPWYRKDVNHGLRFWDCADVGIQCERPEDLSECILFALADMQGQAERRMSAVRKVYKYLDGKATIRAVDAIKRKWEELYG